ncbi:hypothetical protein TNIN_27181 [Trichonephila inaurata madagascariensis]|uniref:Uncharacterized protein n=1 Tax=Trichonephila inaurata madagascariensis TaxID=2747483 RepID=A0A8X6XP41_9ARAC|nr:hypothetical protein TNIN_27181 [Trichonephila inaurata madagascariensis]
MKLAKPDDSLWSIPNEILIGADFYWNIMHSDASVKVSDFLVPSNFGEEDYNSLTFLLMTPLNTRWKSLICPPFDPGVRIVLSELRSTFWILRERQAIKKVLHKCLPCEIFKLKCGKQIEAPLPSKRVYRP